MTLLSNIMKKRIKVFHKDNQKIIKGLNERTKVIANSTNARVKESIRLVKNRSKKNN